MNSQQQKFSQGVQAVLATWPSFRSVISREASSNPIAENLVEAIIEYCHDCSISGHDDHDTLADSLAQLLADFMNDVFEIIIEDGSIEQVCIMSLFSLSMDDALVITDQKSSDWTDQFFKFLSFDIPFRELP